jgi:hypothetical protein
MHRFSLLTLSLNYPKQCSVTKPNYISRTYNSVRGRKKDADNYIVNNTVSYA